MVDKVYIVTSVGDWDSWDIGYYKTRKGALKAIMTIKYDQWMLCRYIPEGGYDDHRYYVKEQTLHD